MTAWRFEDPPETLALTLRSILEGKPVLFAEHDARGGWYWLDAAPLLARSELALASLQEIVAADPGLSELADLPRGWRAWRLSKEEPWQRESSLTLDKTRERMAQALAELDRHRVTLPPDSPSTTELLREDRDR